MASTPFPRSLCFFSRPSLQVCTSRGSRGSQGILLPGSVVHGTRVCMSWSRNMVVGTEGEASPCLAFKSELQGSGESSSPSHYGINICQGCMLECVFFSSIHALRIFRYRLCEPPLVPLVWALEIWGVAVTRSLGKLMPPWCAQPWKYRGVLPPSRDSPASQGALASLPSVLLQTRGRHFFFPVHIA